MNEKIEEMEQALLNLEEPSSYLNQLLNQSWFQTKPWNLLYQLCKTKQSPVHHPEGNVWNHTMMVVDEAAKVRSQSKNPRVFMWAALLHDIGKPDTTRNKKGKITSYNHDSVGAYLAYEFLQYFFNDTEFMEAVAALVRWHMQVLYVDKNLPFSNIQQMVKEVDKEDIALLAWCDRMGRTNAKPRELREEIRRFYHKISK